ncbi:MAG: NUDIX domain-containing protein [Planctomycetes bacterium]|nr:NUDIX domain-containing protein [Planctomycetota bacterium]
MAGRIAVVDGENRFVRWEERRRIHEERLVHRSIYVLVFDAGRLLIQRRHRDKQTFPSHWDVSCAGHVEESDYPDPSDPDAGLDAVYQGVARRELEEELGIQGPELVELAHVPPLAGVHYEQIRLYRTSAPGPFTLQAEEVEEVQFVTPAQLAAMQTAGEPITAALTHFSRWLAERGAWGP